MELSLLLNIAESDQDLFKDVVDDEWEHGLLSFYHLVTAVHLIKVWEFLNDIGLIILRTRSFLLGLISH